MTSAKRQLLFVQGGGKGTHDEWDDKLVESLRRELGQDYEIRYPRMPNEEDPSYPPWKTTLEREIETLRDGAILVGHSVGGTILLKVLTEQSPARELGAIFLIAAPFVGDGGWPAEDLRFPPDLGTHLPEAVPIYFYHGLADETAPPAHAELYARAVPQASVHRLAGRDHQLDNDLREVAAAILSLEACRSEGSSQRRTDMKKPAKNTICLWYNGDAEEAARFYAETFPDSSVDAVHLAPGDFPSGKKGDVLTVEFTVLGVPCLGLNGGPAFKHNEAFSFQVATEDQAETDRYWNAIVGNGGEESACGWCKDKWGLSWQITPIALTQAITDPDPAVAKRAFDAMMEMRKIDVAAIEAARRG